MNSKFIFAALLIFFSHQMNAQSTKIDSVIHALKGSWRWDYQRGGFGPFPPSPASYTAYVLFSQDAQDSLNQTLTYSRYRGFTLEKTAHTVITHEGFNGFRDIFSFLPDVFPFWGSDTFPGYFWFESDTLEMTWNGGDIPTFGFLKDSFTTKPIDTIISELTGCWRWDHYFGGFAGLPPTAATSNIQVEFFQDAQDSANHSISCNTRIDSSLTFTGRCNLSLDTLGYGTLSCPLFDSTNIVGSPPIYFNFENDTLLFPQQEFVDGFVYAFLKDCDDTTTDVEHPDEIFTHIFPNPASEYIMIRLDHSESIQLNLFNAIGRKLATLESADQRDLMLNVSQIPDGIYFISIHTAKGALTRKIIIQRH